MFQDKVAVITGGAHGIGACIAASFRAEGGRVSSVYYEEQEIGDGIGYIFGPTENPEYPSLSSEDRQILEEVIGRFGDRTKREIVKAMHQEDAYRKTAAGDIILYRYTRTLSME